MTLLRLTIATIAGVLGASRTAAAATRRARGATPVQGQADQCAVGHGKGSMMDHEWLFWDNHEFFQQIGLAQ